MVACKDLSVLLPKSTEMLIPAFFFAHGTPALLKEASGLQDRFDSGFEGGCDGPQASFLHQFGQYLLQTYKPKAIVVFSAHFETHDSNPIQILDNTAAWQSKNLYYDYYGFPDAMYKLKFESRTDSTISRRIADLLTAANINNELVRDKRGLDHGVFVPFKHMFTDICPVPIIEVSQFVDARKNVELGRALQALRSEGCIILAGGLTIHTFEDFAAFAPSTAKQGYKAYETKLKSIVETRDLEARNVALFDILNDEWFKRAHPTIEHFTPMYIALGTGGEGRSTLLSGLHGALTVAFGL